MLIPPRMAGKTTQLQLRISPSDKAAIQKRAKLAGMDVSVWVLNQLIKPEAVMFQELARNIARSSESSFALAAMNDFLTGLPRARFSRATTSAPACRLTEIQANYLAAMVEYTAALKQVSPPAWTMEIADLGEPFFASQLESLRLYLLLQSPPPFRRRNLFIDATVGDRV